MARCAALLSACAAAVTTFAGLSVAAPADSAAAALPPTTWSAPTVLGPESSSFDPNTYDMTMTAMPQHDTLAVWGKGDTLQAALYSPGNNAWAKPHTVTTDGVFGANDPWSAPSVAVSSSGEATIAWIGYSSTMPAPGWVLEVATLNGNGWSSPVAVDASNDYPAQPQVSYGANGVAAVAWQAGSSEAVIDSAVRAATPSSGAKADVTQPWSTPVQINDSITTDAEPVVEDPRVAITHTGQVVATWRAYDGVDTNSQNVYRLRSSNVPSGSDPTVANSWTAPTWVSPAGQDAMNPTLVLGTDDTVTATWLNSGAPRDAHFDGTSWSAAEAISDLASDDDVAAGPNGTLTAITVGQDPVTHYATLRSAQYTPASGWAPSIAVIDNSGVNDGLANPIALADSDGTTAYWLEYGSTWTVRTAHLSAGTTSAWGASATVPETTGTQTLDAVRADGGYDRLLLQVADPDGSQRTHGQWSVQGLAQVEPKLTIIHPLTVTGTLAVGKTLHAQGLRFSPTPDSVQYVWDRDGHPINSSYSAAYTVRAADAGHTITVAEAGDKRGYVETGTRAIAGRIPAAGQRSTKALLGQLAVTGEHAAGYRQSAFPMWDAQGGGCNTRDRVLIAEAITRPHVSRTCALTGGKWRSPYDALTTTRTSSLAIDHLVPLAEAWQSGAYRWNTKTREAYANDLGYGPTLVAVSTASSRAKGSSEPSAWLPTATSFDCAYQAWWVAVKWRWHLSVNSAEKTWLTAHLASCGWPTVATPSRPTIGH